MQLNVICLNNLNIATLSMYTWSNYDVWWKHDGFDHDVTSIKLGYPPIYKWIPQLRFTQQYTKNISTSSHISIILNVLATSIINGGWGSNVLLVIQRILPYFFEGQKYACVLHVANHGSMLRGVKCRE